MHSTLVARTDGRSMTHAARSHRSCGFSNSLPSAQWPHYAQHAPQPDRHTEPCPDGAKSDSPRRHQGHPADVRFLTQSQDAPERPGRHRPGQEPEADPCRVHSAQDPGVQNRPQGAPQPGHDRSAFPQPAWTADVPRPEPPAGRPKGQEAASRATGSHPDTGPAQNSPT